MSERDIDVRDRKSEVEERMKCLAVSEQRESVTLCLHSCAYAVALNGIGPIQPKRRIPKKQTTQPATPLQAR